MNTYQHEILQCQGYILYPSKGEGEDMFTTMHYEVIADLFSKAVESGESGSYCHDCGEWDHLSRLYRLLQDFSLTFGQDNERFKPSIFWQRSCGGKLNDVQEMMFEELNGTE